MNAGIIFRSFACLALDSMVALAQSPSSPPPEKFAQAPVRATLEQLQKRAAGLLPTKQQLRYQEIPWVHDLAEAQQVAQKEKRPIFLWGYGSRARPDNGLEGC